MTLKVWCALFLVVALPFVFEATTGCSFHTGSPAPTPAPVSPNSYACECNCEPGQHERDVRVSAALDDAEEDTNDAVDLDLGVTIVGVRFANLDIPQGAPIVSATVQFTADSDFEGDNTVASNLEIFGVAEDNVPSFGGNFTNLLAFSTTGHTAIWTPPAWSLNQSGPAQLTSNLKDVIQEIVNRPGWQPGNALALLFEGLGRREAVAYDRSPARAALFSVDYLQPVSAAVFDLHTCVPPALDGNLPGGTVPTDDQLQADCQNRVQPTLSALDAACGYPSMCTCNFVSGTLQYAGDVCDTECTPNPVNAQCTNFDPENGHVDANTAGTDPPVCTAFSPLAADVFGQRTSCAVQGTAQITVSGGGNSDTENSQTMGVVEFNGDPCPGQSCAVGMDYHLGFANVQVGNFFESATFNQLAGVGENMAGNQAMLSPTGDGTFAPQALGAAAQGRRDQGHLQGLVSTNADPVDVNVGWGQSVPTCSVNGTLVGNVDPELKECSGGPDNGKVCQSDSDCAPDPGCTNGVCSCEAVGTGGLSMSLDVTGAITNQPPHADAGPDQDVQCTAAAVTNVVLDGSNSTDPDDNIVTYTWLRGSRVGDEVGSEAVSHVQQTLGSETYVLRVIDALGQADEDTTQVNVVDTTPPVVTCSVATPMLSPPNHDLVNVGLAASAVDQCEGVLPVTVSVFGNEDDQDNTGDGVFSPDATNIAVGTLRLRAERKGNGNGRVYLIIPESTDSSGNRGFSCCTVTVPRSSSPAALTAVQNQAAIAKAYCLANEGTPPAGYFVIGDGPVIGPKQ